MAQQQHPPGAAPIYPPTGQIVYPTEGSTVVHHQQGHTVVVQTAPAPAQPKKKGGFFSSLTKELDKAGKSISKGIDSAAVKIGDTADQYSSGGLLNSFLTQNIVQLVSKVSGKTVQIVMAPMGHLVVDGLGAEGPQALNAVWTVLNEGYNQVRMHNNNNFLAVVNGAVVIMNVPHGTAHGAETKFQVSSKGNCVCIESLHEKGRHIGILPDGTLKSAVATGKEDHGQFGVRVIYTPHVQQAPPVKK